MSTRNTVIIAMLFALALAMGTVTSAQSSCAISKWTQLPDETENGIDIRIDRPSHTQGRRLLADDFLCEQTGPITCVKFWGSWDKDSSAAGNTAKGTIQSIHLSIHADVPADATNPFSYPSRPALWEMNFDSTNFTETLQLDLCPTPDGTPCGEGFWDPSGEIPSDYGITYVPNADSRIWLYTVNIPDSVAFVQEGTAANPIVYWLDIYVVIEDDGIAHSFGWKTSIDHWNDNAVYDFDGTNWAELMYPPGFIDPTLIDQQIDLAFEINTTQTPPPTEACCYEEMDAAGNVTVVCDDLTVAECLALKGTPLGSTINCATAAQQGMCDPPPPTEACCLPDGSCVNTTPATCQAHNGIPQGANTDCSDVNIDCDDCSPPVVTCPNGKPSVASSFLAGLIDNFTLPVEPAMPDAALSNYITNCTSPPGYALQFDELPGIGGVSANSWFGHTFINLPPGIVSATLEVRARATLTAGGGGLAWNDTIGFVDTISGCTRTDLWINRFQNLPEAGGTWNAGQTATFCLDLDALPKVGGGTTSVISDLASGRLSIFTQDDTGIDSLRLNITICPCEYPIIITIPVEVADNFTAPDSAPASPSAEITGAIAGLKGFDDPAVNRRFVHTFTALPANIIGGTLEIGLKALPDLSFNDSLNLEFLNPNFRWGRAISSLAPAGPWSPGTTKVITLDLASLPASGSGVTTVIGDMTDGDLDVYVQDDTAVDYMILKLKVCCDNGIPGDNDNDGDVDLVDHAIQAANWLFGVGP